MVGDFSCLDHETNGDEQSQKLELDRTLSNNFRDQFSKMSFSQREIIKRQHKKGILVGRDNGAGAVRWKHATNKSADQLKVHQARQAGYVGLSSSEQRQRDETTICVTIV